MCMVCVCSYFTFLDLRDAYAKASLDSVRPGPFPGNKSAIFSWLLVVMCSLPCLRAPGWGVPGFLAGLADGEWWCLGQWPTWPHLCCGSESGLFHTFVSLQFTCIYVGRILRRNFVLVVSVWIVSVQRLPWFKSSFALVESDLKVVGGKGGGTLCRTLNHPLSAPFF